MIARVFGLLILIGSVANSHCVYAQAEDELARGAKKEAKVTFWSSMRIEDSRALAADPKELQRMFNEY